MIDDLPNEMQSIITDNLDILSKIRLGATCRDMKNNTQHDNIPYMVFVKTPFHTLFMYDTKDFVDNIQNDLTLAKKLYLPAVKQYHLLTAHEDMQITFIDGEQSGILFYIMPKADTDFRMLEGTIQPNKKIKLTLHATVLDTPLFLLFIGVQLLVERGGSGIEANFDMAVFPEWFRIALGHPNYSGVLFSELFSSSATLGAATTA